MKNYKYESTFDFIYWDCGDPDNIPAPEMPFKENNWELVSTSLGEILQNGKQIIVWSWKKEQ